MRIVALTPSMTKITTVANLVNFSSVTLEILWLICMSGESTYAKNTLCAGLSEAAETY